MTGVGPMGHDGGTEPTNALGDSAGDGFTRTGLALAAATGSAFGTGATVAALGIPVMFLGVILGAVVGTALAGGKSADSAVGAVAAVGVIALCVEVGVVVPGALVSAGPAATVGVGQYVPYSLAGIPIVLAGAFFIDRVRNRVRMEVVS